MDFSDIVDKAKQGFDVVCKKTEDVVSVSKLKIDKASLESKLSKSYEMLGQICYDQITAGEELSSESVSALIGDISENIAAIEDLNIKIQSFKNKKICPHCGGAIESNFVFCGKCGKKI
ncbi:MAG: zinc ribbon domain-containing protein [Clostridia bacterium]|nr:zinc ribbon domain-containing protein [Clostridia bacterium]